MSRDQVFAYAVTEINSFNEHVSQIFLQPSYPIFFPYEAGQYVNVLHPSRFVSSLSIACAPHENSILEFHLFHPPENKQAQELLHLAKQEGKWQISGPYGHCTVGKLHQDKPILFIARGTGFSPIKAVIEALTLRHFYRPIHLYWSMPKHEHFYLLDRLNDWTALFSHFTFTLQSLDQAAAYPYSLKEKITSDHASLAGYQAYVSGSQVFVSELFSILFQHGLERDYFYSDMSF